MSSPSKPVPVPSSRISRLSRMGTMAAGVAGNMALNGLINLGRGERPTARDLLMTPRNIQRVADELAKMRGAAMKVGQLLSMDTGDVLPPELADIMARLRADADFMPPKQLKQVLNAEFGEGWLRQFESFDVRPIAAASIGQVHRAKLKDGTDLAIKVQYPGIARSIDSDVANVGRLIKIAGVLPSGFDLDPYLDEACAQLHDEADYIQESGHLRRFGALLDGERGFALPDVIDDLTGPRVMTMTFVAGDNIEAALSQPQDIRDDLATRLIRLMLRELFEFGLMQTDPNFANYRFDPATGRIVLLDFGATRAVPRSIVEAYGDLMRAGLRKDRAAYEEPAHRLGILSPSLASRHQDAILDMMELVFDRVTQDAIFDFARTDLSRRLQAMGEALAQENVVPPPPPMDVLYVQRKFAGMFLLASRLQACVPVDALLNEALAEGR